MKKISKIIGEVMSEKKTSIVSILNIILLIIYFFTIILFSFIDDSTGMDLNRNKIATFNDGWSISYNNIIEDDILLPQNYHFKPNSPYSIERIINKKDFIYSTIRIRSSMMDVKAYIDDQLIYDFDIESNYKGFQLPYPSSWQLINIPIDKSIGKTLKITFSSPTTQFSGLINTIMIGEGEAIILNILKENILNLIISILIIFLFIFITSLFIVKFIIMLNQFLKKDRPLKSIFIIL